MSVHRMVQAVVRTWLGEEKRAWEQRVVKALSVAWPDPPDYETWGTCERLYPQKVVAERIVAEVEDAEARRVIRLSNVYERCRWFHEALERQAETFASAKAKLLQWIRDGGDPKAAEAQLSLLQAEIEAKYHAARSETASKVNKGLTKRRDSGPGANRPKEKISDIILELNQIKALDEKLNRRRQLLKRGKDEDDSATESDSS